MVVVDVFMCLTEEIKSFVVGQEEKIADDKYYYQHE